MSHLSLLLQDAAPVISAGDTAWVLVSAALVLVMVPGLAFFYGGSCVARAPSTRCS
jgi:ammonium transporter, Amt family